MEDAGEEHRECSHYAQKKTLAHRILSAVPGGNCMQVDEQWPVHADNVHLIERFHAVDMARASVIRIFAFAAAVVIVSKRGGAGGGNRSSDTGAGSTTPPRNQQIPFF